MAVSRDTVSIVLLLCVVVALIALIVVKWFQKKETFIEHFYDDKEYTLRQAVMTTFDELIKRKATPQEVEKYSSEHNTVDDVIDAIKQDFHLEDFKQQGIRGGVVAEEELVFVPVKEGGDTVTFKRAEVQKLVTELKGYVTLLEKKLVSA